MGVSKKAALLLAVVIVSFIGVAIAQDSQPQSEEALPQPGSENTGGGSLEWISPLEGQIISGVQVLLVSLHNISNATANWFSIGGEDFNGNLNGELLSADFNTQGLADNNYDLLAKVCDESACFERQIRVEIKNSPAPPVEQIPDSVAEQKLFSLSTQNPLIALKAFGQKGELIDSSTQSLLLPQGTYNLQATFIGAGILRETEIRGVAVDSNFTPLEIYQDISLQTAAAKPWMEWKAIAALRASSQFSSGTILLDVPSGSTALFKCESWDFSALTCENWERVQGVHGAKQVSVDFDSSNIAFGFAAKAQNANLFRKLGSKNNFSLGESAHFEFAPQAIAAMKTRGAKEVSATLRGTGVSQDVTNSLMRLANGNYSIQIENNGHFGPGIYSIDFEASDGEDTLSQSVEFAWGLVSLNTKKSIYRPGEAAELEMVVLDYAGRPVCGAQIDLNVTEPNGAVTNMKTGGAIAGSSDCGIYYANFNTRTEGTHAISLTALAAGVSSEFTTDFLVEQNYDFDIVRETASKIDPTINNNIAVKINVESFTGAQSVTVRELVPEEFELYTSAQVENSEDSKMLTWQVPLVNGRGSVDYSYSVPLKWPVLYALGRAQIIYADGNFDEARQWYVAVDPITTTEFHMRADNDYNLSNKEPRPADAVTGDTYTGTPATFSKIFSMSPIKTSLTSTSSTEKAGASFRQTDSVAGNKKAAIGISPPLAAQAIASGTWTASFWYKENTSNDNLQARQSIHIWADGNDAKSSTISRETAQAAEPGTSLQIGTISFASSNAVTVAKKDKLIWEMDWNTTAAGPTTPEGDYNFNTIALDANLIFSGTALQLYSQLLQPPIDIPTADANNYSTNVNFLVQTRAMCDGNYFDCGSVDSNIQWCSGVGCSTWKDANSSSGAIQLVSGANPQNDSNLNLGNSITHTWVMKATVDGNYELRVATDGNVTDLNTSSGTDRTMAFTTNANDYSFVLSLPSSGCTQGQGSIDAGTSCDKGYFTPNDLTGNSDDNQISPQGQSGTQPFYVYDNQSSSSSDLNIMLDLNANLPATLVLKVSDSNTGYSGTCSGTVDTNCIIITSTQKNAGKALYSTGTKDLNIWLWSDFINAALNLLEDRNLTSTGTGS